MSQTIWNYFPSYAFALYASILFIKWQWKRLTRLPYPPGPKGLPLIGNIRDIPQSDEGTTYEQWSRQYNSDVIHLKLPGAHLMVVNSAKAAFELFDKRSAIYSDRPRLPMLTELVCWDMFSFYRYGSKWRTTRRLFHQFFNANAIVKHRPREVKAAHEFLYRLAHTPEDYKDHVHIMAGSLILGITYGIDVQSSENPYMQMAEETMKIAIQASVPGAFLVDTLPILKYLPEWFPGAGFKTLAKEWQQITTTALVKPFQHVKDNMAKGVNPPSVVSEALERCQGDADLEVVARSMSGIAYLAGVDTTISAVLTFFFAMVLHPDVVRKAQEELDRVVGQIRLPGFSDRPSLPYVSAIMKEVIRWHSPTPQAFVHRLMVDDVYEGMFLPAGSLVIGNAWAILYDKDAYKDPETFNPDRFLRDGKLDPDVRPPEVATFGFGRRICPGRHLALDTLFLNFACILATFDIGKAMDEHGRPITPKDEFTSGLFSRPLPFKCSIKPRSKQAYSLITEAYAVHHP